MARILAYTSPARSHLFPLTPILDELHRRGHQIVLRTLSSQLELMRSRGFDAAALDERIEAIEHQDWTTRSPRKSLRLNVQVFCARAQHDAPDLTQAIADTQPDAVLVDFNSWGSLVAAEAWGGPWAAFCPYPLPLRSTDAPPYGPGFAPARGALGHLRDRVVRPLLFGALERQMGPMLNGIREQEGLAPLAAVDEWFARPPLLLYMTAEPFEYPRRDWPANVVMIGPCAWDPPADPPAWLQDSTRPIVLVNTSSEFQDDGRLVQVAMQALADQPVTVVATLPAGDPAQFQAPANAHVERFIPRARARSRRVRRHTRRHGLHAEGARAGRASVCRAVRTRPTRGRSPRRGRSRRDAAARQPPARRPPQGQGQRGHRPHRRSTADRRRLQRHRRGRHRSRRRRGSSAPLVVYGTV
jgi:UDP:flavonoid glycosyltransferase YjiC (YdhE family)